MEKRVNSIETEVTLLKSQMQTCQSGLLRDMEELKNREPQLPKWMKTAATAVIIAIFGQTISSVWWASELNAKQIAMQRQVEKNTLFIDAWPTMHQEVMVGLADIKSESRHMKEMLHELKEENAKIKNKQFLHFKDINNIE
jgi:hypothetical protein